MDDLVVDRDTDRGWEATVAFERGDGAAPANVALGQGVQLGSREAGANSFLEKEERLGDDSARLAHQPELLGSFEKDRHSVPSPVFEFNLARTEGPEATDGQANREVYHESAPDPRNPNGSRARIAVESPGEDDSRPDTRGRRSGKESCMRRIAFALVIALLGAAAAALTASAQETVTVTLSEQSGSGQSGTATLTAVGNQTRVTIQLSNPPADTPQPAHIHPGTCANLNPKPQYPLNNVVNGTSETVVDVPLANLLTGNFAINVHKSGQEISVYVACGNIPARAQVAPATGQPHAGAAQLPLFGGLAALALVTVGAGVALRRARA